MTFANVLIYVALIALVLARRFSGHPIGNVKKLFALPVVVTIIGFAELSHGKLKPLAVTLIVIGAIVSLGLGSLRGRADKVSERDGSAYVQWGVVSLILFCVNIAAKLVLDLIGVAAGEAFSTAEKSLIFTLGLTLVGEAIVLSMRSGAFGQPGRTGDAPVGRAPDRVPVFAPRQQADPRSDDAEQYSGRRHEHHHHDHHDHHGRYED
jgi:hypothetical protein